jgi:hypothetical protein
VRTEEILQALNDHAMRDSCVAPLTKASGRDAERSPEPDCCAQDLPVLRASVDQHRRSAAAPNGAVASGSLESVTERGPRPATRQLNEGLAACSELVLPEADRASTCDLLRIRKALFARSDDSIPASSLVRPPAPGGSCPSECPSEGNAHRFCVRIQSLTWVELSGLEPLTSCMP